MTFATTYALILPAITVERDSTEEVGGMYLEETADRDDMFLENALEPTDVSTDEETKEADETDAEIPYYDEPAALSVKNLEDSGTDYIVTLTYDDASGIPEGAVLTASEIAQDSEEYQIYLEETKKAMGLTEEETLPSYAARFFDIKIMVDEQEFTPESGVSVEITYTEPLADHPDTEVSAVHFADETAEAEVIEANTADVQDDGTASQGLEYATRDSESGLADALGNDYLWRLIWNEDAYAWSIQNVGHPDYYMTLGYFDVTSTYDTMINIDAVTVDQNPNYDLPIWHPDTESIPYSSLESQNSYLGFHFYTDDSYYLEFDNDSRTFSTVRNRNYRIRVVSVPSKQPVITYTQDEIANGNVSSSNGSATDSGHLTISNDTTSTGLSRNVITAQPKAGYSFIGWEVVSGSVVSWGTTGSITENSVTIQPTVTEDTVLRAKFGINPLINVTQNDIDFGSVKYNNGAEDVTSNSQDQEITLSTRGPL